MKRILLLSVLGLIALGCNHDKADAAPAASAAPVVSAAPAAPVAAATASVPSVLTAPPIVDKVPAEEDFEETAATTITAKNASDQLAQLEKELGK